MIVVGPGDFNVIFFETRGFLPLPWKSAAVAAIRVLDLMLSRIPLGHCRLRKEPLG